MSTKCCPRPDEPPCIFFDLYLLLAGDDDAAVEVEADDELFVGERRDLDFDEVCLGELKRR